MTARTRRIWTRRIAGLLSSGILLGLGSIGTLAYWSDTATMEPGTINSGNLDVRLAGNLAGQGGSWTKADATLSDMVPGESFAFTVPVQRPARTVRFTYEVTASVTGSWANTLRWSVYPGGTAGTASTSESGLRSNTCSGTATASSVTLSPTARIVVPSRATLAAGPGPLSENLCVQVSLPDNAPDTAQNATATASFVVNASQAR